jgi:hypothetical protein
VEEGRNYVRRNCVMYSPLFLSVQFISYTFNCVTRHVSVLYASPSGLSHFVSLQFVEYCVICVYIKYHISLKSNYPLKNRFISVLFSILSVSEFAY